MSRVVALTVSPRECLWKCYVSDPSKEGYIYKLLSKVDKGCLLSDHYRGAVALILEAVKGRERILLGQAGSVTTASEFEKTINTYLRTTKESYKLNWRTANMREVDRGMYRRVPCPSTNKDANAVLS